MKVSPSVTACALPSPGIFSIPEKTVCRKDSPIGKKNSTAMAGCPPGTQSCGWACPCNPEGWKWSREFPWRSVGLGRASEDYFERRELRGLAFPSLLCLPALQSLNCSVTLSRGRQAASSSVHPLDELPAIPASSSPHLFPATTYKSCTFFPLIVIVLINN